MNVDFDFFFFFLLDWVIFCLVSEKFLQKCCGDLKCCIFFWILICSGLVVNIGKFQILFSRELFL